MTASGRVALVTGGTHGIGAAIAARLKRDGMTLVVADTAPPDKGSPGRSVRCDVSDETQVRALIADIASQEGQLDALVCNAGIMIRKPLNALTLAEWTQVIGTNLTSTFLLARAAETLLRDAKGCIVTIASTRAHMSEPDTESYAASKGGLLALSHALAVSLGPDVRVNCISPGWIAVAAGNLQPGDHAQHPAGRVGDVGDVAALASFLCGTESGFVTGAEFVIDGGMTRKMIYAG